MLRLRHLNMDTAVSRFVKNVEELKRLPLVTDEDKLLIWGEEVIESIAELSRFNQEDKVCQRCAQSCCPLVHCELYFPGFSRCPIFPYRPAICRMHFCQGFAVNDLSFIREFADIYLNSLLEAKLNGSRKVDLFDSPPLGKYAPQLVSAAAPAIKAFQEGRLDEAAALNLIQGEAARFLSPAESLIGNSARDKALEIALKDAQAWYSGH
jgi:hypothetical protein